VTGHGVESPGVGRGTRHTDLELWVRRGSAFVVAAVAGYASYQHQREFALRGGADPMSAALWPLSVDGLLVLATVGLLKSGRGVSRRVRWVAWLSFVLGIVVSLAANIAAAPTLGWRPVLVAGWPPIALLLAVELLAQRSRRRETAANDCLATDETRTEALPSEQFSADPTAEQVMWNYFQAERARGRIPTGAELDRVAGTNNYGRSVVRQWRQSGRLGSASDSSQRNGHLLPDEL
jgi:hypothetical protein